LQIVYISSEDNRWKQGFRVRDFNTQTSGQGKISIIIIIIIIPFWDAALLAPRGSGSDLSPLAQMTNKKNEREKGWRTHKSTTVDEQKPVWRLNPFPSYSWTTSCFVALDKFTLSPFDPLTNVQWHTKILNFPAQKLIEFSATNV